MTKIVRNRIAYWFFLVAGMAGVIMQIIKWATNTIKNPWYIELCILTLFSLFCLKPLLLLDVYTSVRDVIRYRLFGLSIKKCKDCKADVISSVDPGGEDPDIDDV